NRSRLLRRRRRPRRSSGKPATIIALVKETHSKGVFVKTLVAAVALNNLACLTIFEAAFAAAKAAIGSTGTTMDIVLAPVKEIVFSGLLGAAVGLLLIAASKRILRRDRMATASFIAILLTTGLSDYLGGSALLSCLFLGATLANVTPDRDELGHHVFADFESAIFAIFFTLAGMELDLNAVLESGGLIAVAVVAARFIGKNASAQIAMRIAHATDRVRKNLGFALVPQAGVMVGLIILVRQEPSLEVVHDPILAVGLTAVTLSEIIGPIFTRMALKRSGDYGQDRARLIDFLHEENIVCDLQAKTKEEAIRELTDALIQSNRLQENREHLLTSILDREAEVSTCVGGGLAVPHGVLEGGEKIVGAMGISKSGLDFETPDGRPVHCMVVLGTPPTKRDQHLEVLAALARAIGTDASVQAQLFNARTPAHAYEILHLEESEDFNYFLDDS
ncbi:MAG: PTS sugar transporter subunit IIA, partial [Planctomycetota bacterium]